MGSEPCRNCGRQVTGAFCAECGQEAYARLSFRSLFRDSVSRLFDLDGGFLHTLVALTVRPGETIRQYVDGRRKPLTHPVTYCFLLVTLYALTINFLDVQISIAQTAEFSETERRVYHIIHGLLAYMIFLALWPVAALQRYLFRARDRSVAETYTCCLYAFGHINLLGTGFAAAGALASPVALTALLVLQLAYYVWALRGFYLEPRAPILRGLAVYITGFVVTNLLSLILGNAIVAAGLLEQLESLLA